MNNRNKRQFINKISPISEARNKLWLLSPQQQRPFASRIHKNGYCLSIFESMLLPANGLFLSICNGLFLYTFNGLFLYIFNGLFPSI